MHEATHLAARQGSDGASECQEDPVSLDLLGGARDELGEAIAEAYAREAVNESFSYW